MPIPDSPKIYHIVHGSRLRSIIKDGGLVCDAVVNRNGKPGEVIGMSSIKERRLSSSLSSYPDLHVGDCVPFYFCPRSVMLYVIYMANHPELAYKGGQEPIVHLEADMRQVIQWADANNRRWVFTSSNAGSYYFEDYSDLAHLNEIDWDAVRARNWNACKEEKQAEFLLEGFLPWSLISRIGVMNRSIYDRVLPILRSAEHRPELQIRREWYY